MNVEEIVEELESLLGEDQLRFLVEMTQLMAVLDAVVIEQTLDIDVLANRVWEDKDRIAPKEMCREVVAAYLPKLIADGMIVDGVPTEEAIMTSAAHQAMLRGGIADH